MKNDLPPLMQEEKQQKAKLLGETKAEQEKLRKKEMHRAEDALDEIGQEDDKRGIKATQKAYKEHEKEQLAIKSDRIAWLNAKSKFSQKKIDYFHHVKVIVDYELSWLDLPINYTIKSEVTDDGIKLVLKDRWGTFHIGAFTPSGLGLYDEQACRTSVNKIDDKINQLEASPQSGVYLP